MTITDPGELSQAFTAAMEAAPPGTLGLALSGGGDSTALFALALDWARKRGCSLMALTVDHGLRPESAAEARAVADLCAREGVAHEVRAWQGWDGSGNLQEAAREARRSILGAWARQHGLAAVALGHTADDQAETFLLRLARGSGVGGLAAMAACSEGQGFVWLRPLLQVRRATPRAFLRARGWSWIEDPSNGDPGYDRVKARAMLEALAGLGLTVERLVTTARHMADAREVLDAAEVALAGAALRWTALGEARLDAEALRQAPRGIALQLLADVLTAVAGASHPPRLEALDRLAGRVLAAEEGGTSLHGCILRLGGAQIVVRREPARVAPPVPARPETVWDGRWLLRAEGPVPEGATIGALGLEGLALVERPAGLAAEPLRTTPAVWQGPRLLAAPCAGHGAGWSAELVIADPRRRRILGGR
ncbi:MAG TPA: tRNA lysidine(34) synthetase TilS [Paracoccaceae bacterium]|nr:tRNA lysidine(34) synthetase TilS [Paracoccaceae bacterium]